MAGNEKSDFKAMPTVSSITSGPISRGKWHRRRLAFVRWRRRNISVKTTMMLIGTVVGILAGIGAWFLKWSIGGLSHFFLSLQNPGEVNWWLFALPFAGIMITVCYQRYWVRYSLEHGVSQVSWAIQAHQYRLRTGMCYQPLIANVMTVGLGGSAGAEGPIATAGAAIGSLLGRITGLAPERVRVMIGCGAGAGIAGIFKSPLGGALFTLEVLKMKLDTVSVLVLFVTALFGGITTYLLTGMTFNIAMGPLEAFDFSLIWWAAAFGVFCGIYSIYYNKVTNVMLRLYDGMKNHWLRNILSATVVGLCLLMFPAMYGEGYIAMGHLLNGNSESILNGGLFASYGGDASMMLLLAFLLILAKAFATVSSNSGGGVGGDFAPTLFAGAFAGTVFAWAMNLWFDAGLSPVTFAFFGTAGAFSGIINAPLMATFLVAEMVGFGFLYIFPIAVTSFVSFGVCKIFTIFDYDRGENKSIAPKDMQNAQV